MGFFSSIISSVGKIAKAALPFAAGVLGGEALESVAKSIVGGDAADTGPLTAAGAQAVAAAGGRTALIAAAPGSMAPASALVAPTALQIATGAVTTGVVGQANVFTRTLVQRISRANGTVLSTRTLMGSPFLMNSEVRALRRVAKMIGKAHQKLPRRDGKISEARLNKAVQERLVNLSTAQHLIAPHGKGPC